MQQKRSWRFIFPLAAVLVACAAVYLSGQDAGQTDSPAAKAAPKSGAKGKKAPLAFTPEREAAALNFVERNHAELVDLLDHLKASQPKQYEQAIKEIYRVTERLAAIQERDPLLYDLEVKLWTAQSRVQLLAARLKMGDRESIKNELREALAIQIDARLEVLKHQKQQATERLAKMESDISRLEGNKQKDIERQLETLARGAGAKNLTKAPAGKSGKRAADKKIVD